MSEINTAVKTDAVGVKMGTTGQTPGKVASSITITPATNSPLLKIPIPKPQMAPISSAPLAPKVNSSLAPTGLPKSMRLGSTKNISQTGFFHGVIYSETDAMKTTTAVSIDTPQYVRILLTRRPEQLIPMEAQDYQYAECQDSEALMFGLRWPEKVWPDWAAMPDPERRRVLVVDDITRGVEMLNDANSVIGSGDKAKETTDMRKIVPASKKELAEALNSVLRKPYNLVLVALSKIVPNEVTHEEIIQPDMSPSIASLVKTEFEFVFYVLKTNDRKDYKLLTQEVRTAYEDVDDLTGKKKVFWRTQFAKYKVQKELGAAKVLEVKEGMNLREIWLKIQRANEKFRNSNGGAVKITPNIDGPTPMQKTLMKAVLTSPVVPPNKK